MSTKRNSLIGWMANSFIDGAALGQAAIGKKDLVEDSAKLKAKASLLLWA